MGGPHTSTLTYHVRVEKPIEAGQGLSEYALLLSLIAIMAIAAFVVLGREVSAILSFVGEAI